MCGPNQTMVTELVILGFGNLQNLKYLLFIYFFIVYFVILSGNTMIISLITANPRLHSPMYFFLCNLSSCEIILTSSVMPNMLYIVWVGGGFISLYGCITQFYIYASSCSVECLILTVMGVDRYLAICYPFRYYLVMNNRTCNLLATWCWLFGFVVMSFLTIQVCLIQFCDSNVIDHVFCDLAPILNMSSGDNFIIDTEALAIAFLFAILPFVLIILSYMSILFTILQIPDQSGRRKTFSTCSSHLASVCTYFGTLFAIYLAPTQRRTIKMSKILSLFYTMMTPLLNPLIYSLQNQEMKKTFNQSFSLVFRLLDKNVLPRITNRPTFLSRFITWVRDNHHKTL